MMMMKSIFSAAVAASLFAAVVAGSADAAEAGGKEAAVALVDKAVAQVKKTGVEGACKDFADPAGLFFQGELYVFVQDMDMKMICHAANPKRMNGKDLSELRDADGKYFVKEMAQLARSSGSGWVDYRWINPATQKVEPKSSYVRRVSDTLWLGVGIYRK